MFCFRSNFFHCNSMITRRGSALAVWGILILADGGCGAPENGGGSPAWIYFQSGEAIHSFLLRDGAEFRDLDSNVHFRQTEMIADHSLPIKWMEVNGEDLTLEQCGIYQVTVVHHQTQYILDAFTYAAEDDCPVFSGPDWTLRISRTPPNITITAAP